MAAPSELLKMHIGTIERWVENLANDEDYAWIAAQEGVMIQDGVHISFFDGAIQLNPKNATFDFRKVEPEFAQELIYHYSRIIRRYDPIMIEYADQLPDRRNDYENARVEECLYPGGTIWRRTRYGIWELEIIAIKGNRLEFRDKNHPDSTGCPFISTMRLFATKEDAENPNKEGYPYGGKLQDERD